MPLHCLALPRETPTNELLARLQSRGFSLRVPDANGFVAQTRVLPMVHDASEMPVDVVIGGPGLEQAFYESARIHDLAGTAVRVPRPEHLVVMKLLAARPHDLEDAQAIARRPGFEQAEVAGLVEAIAEGLGEDDIREAYADLLARLRAD